MQAISEGFLRHFEEVDDPRIDNANRRHELSDMLILTILAVICGADSWTEIEAFGQAKLDYLKPLLKLPHGIPSHDTLGEVFARLCPDELQAGFLSWINALVTVSAGEVVAIDGKTLRHSYDRGGNRGAIHMVSAWATTNHVVLGQRKVDDKSNEITAIPQLLKTLQLADTIVTIDAMGCQKGIAAQIIQGQADYVLSLKGNQGQLHEDVKQYLDQAIDQARSDWGGERHETIDKGHGRVEVRRYWITEAIDWLEDKARWCGLRSIGAVESERHIGGQVSVEWRYFIASIEADAKVFARAVRSHWGIENQLHWSLDVTFREDDCRVRQGHAAQNLALVRHLALNLLKNEQSAKVGIKIKRSKAGWDHRYLAKVLAVGQTSSEVT
ncbi:MAG: ISAs1 family transposase [Candidatus Competibacteraceae bacterium]|nr:ISAs1 family transposase [Candidatus Competibacteraceae bacterium]